MKFKKVMLASAAAMACSMVMAGGTAMTAHAEEAVTTMGATVNVHVRSTANNGGSVLGVLKTGEAVQVIGMENGWYKVNYNNQTGYVYNPYLNFEGGMTGDVDNGHETDMRAVCAVHMRRENSVNGDILATLSENEKVRVTGKKDGWYKVLYQDATGYIRADYLDFIGSGETVQAPANKGADTATEGLSNKMVATANVNVRDNTNTDSAVTDMLKAGEEVEVIGQEGEWYAVHVRNKTGFVYQDYLRHEASSELTATTWVNVRSEANNSGAVIGVLSKNEKVQTAGKEGGWYKVSFEGKTGYVYQSFLK